MITTFAHTAAALVLTNGGTLGLAPGTNQVVTGIKGWHGSAGIRSNETPKLWQHGIFSERGYKTERVITLQGHIETQTRAEAAALVDTLAAIMGDGELGTFTVNDLDQGTRWAPVKLAGAVEVEWDSGLEIDVTVDMTSPDPWKYGPARSYSTGKADPGGGLDNDPALFNDSDVIDFGEGGTSGTVTIINEGTAPAPLIFDVNGYWPETGWTITEVGTGRRLVYVGENIATDHVVLDGADGTVMLNGVSDRGDNLIVREWPQLQPGPNTYLFEAVGEAWPLLTVTAAPAWW
jgi:Phage tail protein